MREDIAVMKLPDGQEYSDAMAQRDAEWIGALIEVFHPAKIILPKRPLSPKEIIEMIMKGAAQ